MRTTPKNKQVNNNFLRKSSEIPYSIKTFFLILHLIFGQDFGFGNLFRKKTARLLKHYSTFLMLTTIVIVIWPYNLARKQVWYWCTIIECMVNFFILKTVRYSVYNLLSDIHTAEQVAVLEKETFGVIMSTYALVMLLLKLFVFTVTCIFDSNLYCEGLNHIYLTFYAVHSHAIDLIPEAQIVIRFYIYAYVKNMESILKTDQDLNKFVERYDKITHCQDKIRHISDYCVSINFCYETQTQPIH